MRNLLRSSFVTAALVSAACATTAPAPASSSSSAAAPATSYLAGVHIEVGQVLGPPPAADSDAAKADLAEVKREQTAQGTARWTLAQEDADSSPFHAFAPVLGPSFTPEKAPKTAALFRVLFDDVSAFTRPAKKLYARPRPPLVDASLTTCTKLSHSPSYPSGHSARGWLAALVLAEMLPERAGDVVARGRDYGESRVVCAVHFPSDVDAGRVVGAAVFAGVSSSPAFERDLAAARAELRGVLGMTP